MNANLFLRQFSTLSLLIAIVLSAASVQAQTFTGQPDLSASPTNIEAVVYPLTNRQSAIKVIFNNLTAGGVRVIIRDQTGQIVYNQYEIEPHYRRTFDLSTMPAGNYKVELRKKNELFSQAFSIDTPDPKPVTSYISMKTQPVHKTPETSADKKLIVSKED
ncbi:MAG: hypothetical protein JWP57_1124 [Spirosoma sp.]|nr:hypothetical protein [Spirosoma sp.]